MVRRLDCEQALHEERNTVTRSSPPVFIIGAGVCLACIASIGSAAEPAPPQGIVRLASSASIDVTKDLLSVTFNTNREGSDAPSVQAQLKQALQAALDEARKAARPGQLDVQTGDFSLAPRYTAKGVLNGWQGSAELIVEGRDMQAIGVLSGRISTLTISHVAYKLSRELRDRSEAEVSGRAIANYRAKADSYARQFGYGSYVVREVDISGTEPVMARPMMAMQMKALAAPNDEALATEPGKTTVTVNVSGTVQLVK
jgi:predicted secreted protein